MLAAKLSAEYVATFVETDSADTTGPTVADGVTEQNLVNTIINLSNPIPRHTTGGSVQGGARQGSGAGRSQAGPIASPKRQMSLLPSEALGGNELNSISEARTSEIPLRSNNRRRHKIRASPAFDPQDQKRSSLLAADQWTDAFLSL